MLPALFCFNYILGRVSRFCPGLAPDPDPPTYSLHVAGPQVHAITPIYWLRWGLVNFLPGLASNRDALLPE
jgi:hypothetical protein